MALLLYRRHAKTCDVFFAASERTCAEGINLQNERLRLIALYLPDGSYDNATAEATYSKHDNLCDDAQKTQRRVTQGGDFNAMIGKGRPGEEESTEPYGVGGEMRRALG